MKQLASLIAAGAVGGLVAFGGMQLAQKSSTPVAVQPQQGFSRFASSTSGTTDFTQAAEKTMTTVVHIKATQKPKNTSNNSSNPLRQFFGDDFNFFFGMPDSAPREGTGSGVIIRADGYIVTNNHVVEGADALEVTLHDKRKFKATLVGTDPSTDMAVIKIEEKSLPAIEIGNSDEVRVGEWVLAVGNPFDLTSTVTAGIVSAKGRDINIMRDIAAIESFIQTDAAVNPGNSGGALVDTDGKLIGINTAIATRTGYFAGYSFAVPVNIAMKVVNDLIDFGGVRRGFLGISIQDMDSDIAQDLGVNISEGVHVLRVSEGGAADDAGLIEGDVIIAVDGNAIKSSPELQEQVGRKRPGDVIVLTVNRKGNSKELRVKLRGSEDN